MPQTPTFVAAHIAIDAFESAGVTPATILNIGLGKCFEECIWRVRLPECRRIGVDVRTRSWTGECVHALVGAHDGEPAAFCRQCRSLACENSDHTKRVPVRTTTIDRIALEKLAVGPFLLWMDIEGGELDALRGAENVLRDTPVISLEMAEVAGMNTRRQQIHEFLAQRGYTWMPSENHPRVTGRSRMRGQRLDDRLYTRF
jgi:hypothetical protein